jgi:DNA topoisomerase III
VERHDAIQTFKPEPFWTLQVVVQVTEFRKLTLDWDRVRIFDREVAVMFHQKIKDAKQAKYSQLFYLSLET